MVRDRDGKELGCRFQKGKWIKYRTFTAKRVSYIYLKAK